MKINSMTVRCFDSCEARCSDNWERDERHDYDECMRRCKEREDYPKPRGNHFGSRLWRPTASDGGVVIGRVVALAAGDKEPKEPAPKESPEPKEKPEKGLLEKIYDKIVPDAH